MHPRWEDFDFIPVEETSVNPFGWLGTAMTRGEIDKTETTPYLDSIDVPVVPAFI